MIFHKCGAVCVWLCGSIHSRRVLPQFVPGGVVDFGWSLKMLKSRRVAFVAYYIVIRIHLAFNNYPPISSNTAMPTPEEREARKAQVKAKMERAQAAFKEMERAEEEERKRAEEEARKRAEEEAERKRMEEEAERKRMEEEQKRREEEKRQRKLEEFKRRE